MSKQPEQPHSRQTDPGREALARARAARSVLREQQEQREQQKQQSLRRRRALLKHTVLRTCCIYTALNILYFFVYLAVIYPIKEQPFSDMIRGGASIVGHAVFLAASLLTAFVYSLIRYKRQPKQPGRILQHLTQSSVWFTSIMWLCIAAHGIYLDMLYNQYAVTQAGIFLGPSFLLALGVLLFSLALPAINRIYTIERFPAGIRAILHLLCIMILLPICLQLIAHGFSTAADLLIFLVIFAVLYAFVCIFWFTAKGSIRREENDEEDYESMFIKTPGKASDESSSDSDK